MHLGTACCFSVYIDNSLTNEDRAMKKPINHQLESSLLCLIALLIPVHIAGSYINTINSIDKGYGHSYPMATYILIALWLLIVIAVDVFIFYNKGFTASTALKRYWGISTVILTVMFLIKTTDSVLIALLLLLTPFAMLFPLLEVFLVEETTDIIIVILFCVLNWCICKFVPYKN